MLGWLGAALIVVAVMHLMMVIILACHPRAGHVVTLAAVTSAAVAGCEADAYLAPGHLQAAGAAAAAAVAVTVVYGRMSRGLHPAGAAVWSGWLLLGGVLLVWGAVFLAQLKVSPVTSWLLWATSGLSAVTLPSSVIQTREGWELLLRRRWRRAGQPPSRRFRGYPPRVSVHVPCHAEPPHIVIATLNRLAQLDYPDFEVLVIDNNTTDPQLWQPVAAHCARLGPRFRFFHVEGMTGAKAGALNWVLPRTCPWAELIAVVDADYQVRPDWLRATVGYFADPGIGFVQCPHAYRDYSASVLGRWANWEYRVFFATSMVSLDEHRAGITVGTMSLIRREALVRAGGWAEWCLTEDSELAIRIHAVGYQSVYLTRPYGWGLIPETFDGYRKQRFRWTYGPVQEFRRHWRLFLPRPLAAPSALTPAQKLHHANHGLDVMCIGLRALCLPLGAAAAASMAIHHERVMMPVQLWAAATCVLAASLLMRWLVYVHVVRATPRQALGGILAFAALTHVITMASLRALAGRPARWQRTSKFRQRSSGVRALAGARSETMIGIAGLLAAAGLGYFTRGGIGTTLAVGLAMQALTYLAAPLVTIAADRSLAQNTETLLNTSRTATPPALHPRNGQAGNTPGNWQRPRHAGSYRDWPPSTHPTGQRPAWNPGNRPVSPAARHEASNYYARPGR